METSFGTKIIRLTLKCHKIGIDLAESAGLSVNELHCLLQLHLERPCCARKLTELLGINPTSTSKLLRSLDRKGYISRSLDATDRRMERIALTETGLQKAHLILDHADETGERLLTQIPEERIVAFTECIGLISAEHHAVEATTQLSHQPKTEGE